MSTIALRLCLYTWAKWQRRPRPLTAEHSAFHPDQAPRSLLSFACYPKISAPLGIDRGTLLFLGRFRLTVLLTLLTEGLFISVREFREGVWPPGEQATSGLKGLQSQRFRGTAKNQSTESQELKLAHTGLVVLGSTLRQLCRFVPTATHGCALTQLAELAAEPNPHSRQ